MAVQYQFAARTTSSESRYVEGMPFVVVETRRGFLHRLVCAEAVIDQKGSNRSSLIPIRAEAFLTYDVTIGDTECVHDIACIKNVRLDRPVASCGVVSVGGD